MKLTELVEALNTTELNELFKRFKLEVFDKTQKWSDDALLTSIEEFLKANHVRPTDLKTSVETIALQLKPDVKTI